MSPKPRTAEQAQLQAQHIADEAFRSDTAKTTALTTAKNGLPVGAMIPQAHGGALRNGGTNAGGHGRPSTALRDRCVDALEQPEVLEGWRIVARDPMHPAYSTVINKLLLYGHGMPGKAPDSPSDGTPQILVVDLG